MAFSWSLQASEVPHDESGIVTTENSEADGDITRLSDFMMLASRLGIEGPRIRQAIPLDSSYYKGIGQGGQFQVFKHSEFGYDGRGGAAVAKRVSPKLYATKTPDTLRDLRLEVQVLAQDVVRRHPNIIDLIAWGYDYPHLATETIKPCGEERYPIGKPIPVLFVQEALCSLNDFLQPKYLNSTEIPAWNIRCHIATGVVAGLECIHGIGVLHNDLKPANILICRQDSHCVPFISKLADFGMSLTEAKSTRDYGRTIGWRPPEARFDNADKYGEFSNEVLFKCESFAYGLVAIYTVCYETEESPVISDESLERESPIIPETSLERKSTVWDLLLTQKSFSTEDKNEAMAMYLAVEQRFLKDDPRIRERVSLDAIKQIVPSFETWNTAFAESKERAARLAASRKRPHSALGLYQNRGGTLLHDLEAEDVDTYPGELLFEMAVAKGVDFDPIHGIDYNGMLELVIKATTTQRLPSLAGAGVIAQLLCAFNSTSYPPRHISQENLVVALQRAIESGSIVARPTLEAIEPGRLKPALEVFQSRGSYNQEGHILQREVHGMTALSLAEQDHEGLTVMLSSKKAMRTTNNTELHIAAMLGKREIIEELVKKPGVSIDSLNNAGETPLYKACLAGQYEAVKILIENGADPCVRVSDLKISCLHWLFAFPLDDMEKTASLLTSKGLSVEARVLPASEITPEIPEWTRAMHFPFHWPAGTPLHWAAHAESPDAVDVLVRAGASVDQPDLIDDLRAQTALSMAMYRGSVNMVSHLLAKGANAARIDGRGCSQLHMIAGERTLYNTLFSLPKHFMQWCYQGGFENALASARFCVSKLTNAGISIDCERAMGRTTSKITPLQDAVNNKNTAAIIALLDGGANANVAESYTGKLPLHIWTETDSRSLAYPDTYLPTLRALLENTAHPEQRDSSGQSVVHLAMVGADAVGDSDRELWRQKLHLLLQYCPKLGIDDRDEDGRSLLLQVVNYDARHGWNVIPAIEVLQHDFGADICLRDNDNCDFLWNISRKQGLGDDLCLHAIDQYLNRFPKEKWVSVLNKSQHSTTKWTALMNMTISVYPKCVSYALAHGADPNIANSHGETALGLSIEAGNRYRLNLYSRSSMLLKRMPKQDDEILKKLFYEGEKAYGSSAWAGEAESYYFGCPKIRDELIKAGARTGKQLGTTENAPDVKTSEQMNLEELGWWEYFKRDEQPFYDMWKISYDFDDD